MFLFLNEHRIINFILKNLKASTQSGISYLYALLFVAEPKKHTNVGIGKWRRKCFQEVKPLKIVPIKQITLFRVEIGGLFTRCFAPKKFYVQDQHTGARTEA
jgi:hypothetical protein